MIAIEPRDDRESTRPAGAGPRDATRGGVNVAACRDRGGGNAPSRSTDWICALKKAGVDLARVSGGIPFLGTLLKTEQDVEAVTKRAKA